MRPRCRSLLFSIGCLCVVLLETTVGMAQQRQAYSPPIRDPQRFTSTRVQSLKALREKNIVMQQHDYSCGAAALATLIRYYWGDPMTESIVLVGILSTLEKDEIKDRVENGLSIADLEAAAEKLGYFAEVGSGTMKQLSEAKAPAIVRIIDGDFEHFVVYRGIIEDRVFLADPIRGHLRMPVEKFMCQWLEKGTKEGIVLVVAKQDVEELPKNAPLSLRHHPCKPVIPELQPARRGLFLQQTREFLFR